MGPTLRVSPGDTLSVKLVNQLPPDDTPYEHNQPGNFNVINLHTHGLHVSPSGNSDNVLLELHPGQEFQYEITIPRDHPAGTFWYHAHVHGSTALHVSSGMAGVIIVEGGIDKLPEIAAAKEQIMLLQQISYDEKGELENYDNFGGGAWAATKRQTTINGQIVPVIRMQPGEIQRWRFIHAGVRETVLLRLKDHQLHEIAVDGLTLGFNLNWEDQPVELEPGYRSDILVRAEALPQGVEEQTYLLVDDPSTATQSLHGIAETEKILARVIVSGTPMNMKMPQDEDLAKYRPHKDIDPAQVTGHQKVEFSVESGIYMVNGKAFTTDHVRTLKLGAVESWTLSTADESTAPNHPYHIHVNPFQYLRKGPDGTEHVVWRDTLMVKKGEPITVYSRYERYIGKFVLHCHILDHEDQGMMEFVEVTHGTTHGEGHAGMGEDHKVKGEKDNER